MDDICKCPELRFQSPTESEPRTLELADGLAEISSKDIILTGCVGCIDGWLCEIRAPSAKELPDVTFFSRVTTKVCDSLSRLTGYCFDSPGMVGDSIAFKKWK
ncbi:Hypothetical protein PHPALM_19725 [Phytophthora palmivora]|uniref:Uncharacterized protein n=1 Tax=Phytophthora palmivora TaxID=4796 RepID=A0A2P4XGP1_9STRA|nr:Hypothetical protein PHPALM_19725 [Phytophthora palmivora]